jgi:HD superfamily phosphodiesterase
MNILRRLRRPRQPPPTTKHVPFYQFFSTSDGSGGGDVTSASDGSGAVAPATVTRKEIRAWCRQAYGNDWWVVDPLVKQERMLKAKQDLHRPQPQHTPRFNFDTTLDVAAPTTVYDATACDRVQHELERFCTTATQGRGASHGVQHMNEVREGAVSIFDALVTNGEKTFLTNDEHTKMRCMVIAAAQLHDVDDHKYVDENHHKDQGFSCQAALLATECFATNEVDSIVHIMSAVSFSKEYKERESGLESPSVPFDYTTVLGESGAFVRDVVSDADKLLAIGAIGVERCLEYVTFFDVAGCCTTLRRSCPFPENGMLVVQEHLLFVFDG